MIHEETGQPVEFPSADEVQKMFDVQLKMIELFQENELDISEVIKVCTASMVQVVASVQEHEEDYALAVLYAENAFNTSIDFLRNGTLPTAESLVGGGVTTTVGNTED